MRRPSPTASSITSATAVTTNAWHHVVATYDGSTFTIFIDGVFDASMPESITVSNGVGSLQFAHNAALAATNQYNNFLQGDLDEVRWYSRALTSSEAKALFCFQ